MPASFTPNPARGVRGMVTAPNALASQSALAVLREGGNAVEAMVAAAATIAVVYPHMNSIGGDGFWLISKPGQVPIGIEACGAAALAVNAAALRRQGLASIPFRGGVAANTVAGTISGWESALNFARENLGAKLPLACLLGDAITYARDGIPVTKSQSACTAQKLDGLKDIAGFAETFLTADGQVPKAGDIFCQPRLAATLQQLSQAGLDDFYRGDVAVSMARDLQTLGSPVALVDLHQHQAVVKNALVLQHSLGRIYNMPPPTQGLVSLMILGLLDRIFDAQSMDCTSASYVHACVEATKQAFAVRDRYITDPTYMTVNPAYFLQADVLDKLAADIDLQKAQLWGKGQGPADTIWMGVIDGDGVAVSFIQSIYHEFGSGLVLPESGVNWQNRGCSFSLDADSLNPLQPGRKPFHTLNPAMAQFDDGRTMVYGNMGGDGQPQSQSAVFSRIAYFGLNPQAAIAAPRWLLGRTWGQTSESLKLESRFPDETIETLRQMGHEVDVLKAFDETMGHAGAILRYPNGTFEGGNDPRSDGCAMGW